MYDVTTVCDTYEASFAQHDKAVSSRIAKNAELNDKFAQRTATEPTITHMVSTF